MKNPNHIRFRASAGLAGALAVFQLCAALAPAQQPDSRWVASWGTAQQHLAGGPVGGGRGGTSNPSPPPAPPPAPPAGAPARRFPIPPRVSVVDNQTVRMVVRASVGGGRLRVRFANALGGTAVAIGSASIGLHDGESRMQAGSVRALTFGGRTTATLYAGATLVSDPVELDARPMSDLVVSVYAPGRHEMPTSHLFGLRPTYLSRSGDFTGSLEIADPQSVVESYVWLAGVDVLAGPDAGTLVTFGDSITDGDQSTPAALHSWPAILAARLQGNPSTAHVGVVNAGIAGNRILGDGNSGLARFQAHALAQPGVRWVTLLEGINDISFATRPGAAGGSANTARDLIFAYRQIIAHAHERGVKVIGCTLTPYGGSSVFSEAGEAIRSEVNAWIRTGGEFDAVVDFDAVLRDPAQPTRMRPEAESPDLLHPGDGGYRLMAEAFDPALFQRLE